MKNLLSGVSLFAFLLVLVATGQLSAQTRALPDTLLGAPFRVIKNLPTANDIETDEEGNLFLLDSRKNRVYKLLKISNYDSLIQVGGKATGGEGLNNPTELNVPTRNMIYLLDYNNRRIVLYNVNLRIVREYNFVKTTYKSPENDLPVQINPVSFAVSPTGDFFILNSDDNKVFKIDNFGRLERIFGGTSYGEGSLYAPARIEMTTDNFTEPFLYISDTAGQMVKVFDNFGVFQYNVEPKFKFRWNGIVLFDRYLFFLSDRKMGLYDVFTRTTREITLPFEEKIIDLAIRHDGLYILLQNRVILYKI